MLRFRTAATNKNSVQCEEPTTWVPVRREYEEEPLRNPLFLREVFNNLVIKFWSLRVLFSYIYLLEGKLLMGLPLIRKNSNISIDVVNVKLLCQSYPQIKY